MLLSFLLISGLLFLIGTVVGSFLSVVVYRTLDDGPKKKKESWMIGRSRCDNCGYLIAWYDNIPLLSFVLLGGKCRYCHTPIPRAYPFVELLTGSMFVWWYWGGSLFFQLAQAPFQTLQPLFWLLIGILFVIVLLSDTLYLVIPDWTVVTLTFMTLVYRVTLVSFGIMQPVDLALGVLGVVLSLAFFALLWFGTRGRGFGLGDVKLIVPLALLVGWPHIFVTVFLAFVIGAVVGVGLIAGGRKRFGQVIPFGPFLIIGTVLTLVWGDQMIAWYTQFLR